LSQKMSTPLSQNVRKLPQTRISQ